MWGVRICGHCILPIMGNSIRVCRGRLPHSRVVTSLSARNVRSGFTLLELLVAVVVFAMILAILLGIIGNVSTLTRRAGDRISTFQAARAAFDTMSANLSQATLNTYWDYDNPLTPQRYKRMSELHFLVGQAGTAPFPGTPGTGQAIFFQAPMGFSTTPAIRTLPDVLNSCGYYIEYANTETLPAPFPASPDRFRYRLMQALDSSEQLKVYQTPKTADGLSGKTWISETSAVPIAENVIYLMAWPRRSPADDPDGTALTGATEFSYNSRFDADTDPQPATAHQMPPVMQITMVVLDEASAIRVCRSSTQPAEITSALNQLFETPDENTFKQDLKTLEERLTAAHLNYQVFSAMIAIRESKME